VTVASCSSSEYSCSRSTSAVAAAAAAEEDGDAMPVHDSWSDSTSVFHAIFLKNDPCELPGPGRKEGMEGRLELDVRCAKPPYASSTSAAFWAACSASIRRCYIEVMFGGSSVGDKNCRGENNGCTSRRASRRSSFSLAWALFLPSSFFANFRL
jgi:hypothetical protein